MKVKDVDKLFRLRTIINHKEDIKKYVEDPLIPICEHLYDLNILTTLSNANAKGYNDSAYIIIDYDTLSSYNKSVLDELATKYPSNFNQTRPKHDSNHRDIKISMPINDDTDTNLIVDFFNKMFKELKIQEIHSFTDAETNIKNIYTLNEFLMYYLIDYRDVYRDRKRINCPDGLDKFLASIGVKKIPSDEFDKTGFLSQYSDFVYFYDSELWITDLAIYNSIAMRKDELFGDNEMSLENLNIEELLNGVNKIVKKRYNEEFRFNSEDGRVYLNEELLNKHKTFLKESQKGFDMQRRPIVILIDDDPSLGRDLKSRLPSVICSYVDINDIIHNISHESTNHSFEQADIIFIDTFYRDEQTQNYAIDFFEMYREIDDKTKNSTDKKYKILVSIDEINYRLNGAKCNDIDVVNERKELSNLLAKVHRHPYIEWRHSKGSKIDKMIEEIEKYAKENKIYLYKNSEMSLEEWKEYIRSFGDKIAEFVRSLEKCEVSESSAEELDNIVTAYNNEITNINEVLGLNENGAPKKQTNIKSIEAAINFINDSYTRISNQIKPLRSLLMKEKHVDMQKKASHIFINSLIGVGSTINRAKRNLDKKEKNR